MGLQNMLEKLKRNSEARIVIAGLDGAGKTTLLKVISRIKSK